MKEKGMHMLLQREAKKLLFPLLNYFSFAFVKTNTEDSDIQKARAVRIQIPIQVASSEHGKPGG